MNLACGNDDVGPDKQMPASVEWDASDALPTDACPIPECKLEMAVRIEQAKREWEATVDALPQLVALLDSSGRVLRVNRVIEHWGLCGVDAGIGRPFHQLLHPRCSDPACQLMHFLRGTQPSPGLSHAAICEIEDERLARHLRIRLTPISIDQAEVDTLHGSAVVVVLEDITQLKQAEAEIKVANERLEARVAARTAELAALNHRLIKIGESHARTINEQQRLAAILEGTSDLVGIATPTGELLHLNAAGRRMLRLDDQVEIRQLRVHDCHPAAEAEYLFTTAVPAAIDNGVWSGETVLVDTAGKKIPVLQVIIAHLDASGAVDRLSTIIRDVSEQRDAMEALRESRNELSLLSAQLLTYQEKERQRISSELHDGLGQTLSAVKFCVEDGLRCIAEGAPEEAAQVLKNAVNRVRGAVEEVRRISMGLRPSLLDDLGIVPTLAWFFREFEAIYHDIHVVKRIEIDESVIADPIKTVIYRLVQEAMNNITRHSCATTVHVALVRIGDWVELTIEDDGCGFDRARVKSRAQHGLGLTGMRERATLYGGTFRVESMPGQGAMIQASWPVA